MNRVFRKLSLTPQTGARCWASFRASLCTALTALIVLFTATAHAVQPAIEGAPLFSEAKEVLIDPDGMARVRVSFDDATAHELTLRLSGFRNETGESVAIGFGKDSQSSAGIDTGPDNLAGGTDSTVKLSISGQQVVTIDAGSVPPGSVYRGILSILTADNGPGDDQAIILKHPQPLIKLFPSSSGGLESGEISLPFSGITIVQVAAGSPVMYDKRVSFEATPFVSESNGRVSSIRVSPVADAGSNQSLAEPGAGDGLVVMGQHRVPLRIDASLMALDDPHVGEIVVRLDEAIIARSRVKLTRHAFADKAEIQIVQPPALELTCWRFDECGEGAVVDVPLREKTSQWPVIGIALGGVASADYENYLDPQRHARFSFISGEDSAAAATTTEKDLWSLDWDAAQSSDQRSIANHSQAKLRIELKRTLSPGVYQMPFRIQALNVDSESHPLVVLEVRVSRPWIYPVIVLFMAVLISYFLTKIIRTQMQRISLRQRISRIRRLEWFRRESSMAAVVDAKALLSQANKALDHSRFSKYLFFPSSVLQNITDLEERLPYAQRLCALKSYWNKSSHGRLVSSRARKLVDKLVDEFCDTPLQDELTPALLTRLENMEQWQDPDKLLDFYWMSLKSEILILLAQVTVSEYSFDQELDSCAEPLKHYLSGPVDLELKRFNTKLEGIEGVLATVNDPALNAQVAVMSLAVKGTNSQKLESVATALRTLEKSLHDAHLAGVEPAKQALTQARAMVENSMIFTIWPQLQSLGHSLGKLDKPELEAALKEVNALRDAYGHWDPQRIDDMFCGIATALEQASQQDREIVRKLRFRTYPEEQPNDMNEVGQREKQYAALKLIHRADDALREKLFDYARKGLRLQDMFDLVESSMWKSLGEGVCVKVKANPRHAFERIYFDAQANDSVAGNSFLFQRGSVFDWEINYSLATGGADEENPPLRVRTDRPRVTQFLPGAGTIKSASVEIHCARKISGVSLNEITGNNTDQIQIDKPVMFGIVAAFQTVELAALAIALVAAVVSGTNTEQFVAAQAGSAEAYFGLFAWGFAADQLKNLLEHMGKIMGESE